ncbi:MAG: XdhC family protein [Clostridiaceae bacterium]
MKNNLKDFKSIGIYKELIDKLNSGSPQVLLRIFGKEGIMDEMGKYLIDPEEMTKDISMVLSEDPSTFLPSGLEEKDVDLILEAYSKGKPLLRQDKGKGLFYFAEPFFPRERLIVLGGGHVAVPVVEFASKCGFKVTVVDDRPFFANKERFPWAEEVICDSFDSYLSKLNVTSSDYIVLVTRGHRYDLDCLRQIFKKKTPRYLGMIGSKRRVAVIKEKLLEEGADKSSLDFMNSPIGLKIGAQTPEEISISIVGELIQRKRLDLAEESFINRSDLDPDVVYSIPGMIKGRSLVTILESNGSVPRGAGASMTVTKDRRIEGSIGGGCSESEVVVTAAQNTGTGRYFIQKIDLSGAKAEDEGMVCGGNMTVLVEDLD